MSKQKNLLAVFTLLTSAAGVNIGSHNGLPPVEGGMELGQTSQTQTSINRFVLIKTEAH